MLLSNLDPSQGPSQLPSALGLPSSQEQEKNFTVHTQSPQIRQLLVEHSSLAWLQGRKLRQLPVNRSSQQPCELGILATLLGR